MNFLFQLRLCFTDQNQGESCHSTSCEQFHLCQYYLLNKTCSEFDSSEKCSHSHSLSTYHNEKILQKYNLSSKDYRTFSLISRLIKLSLTNPTKIIVQTIKKQTIPDQFIDQWLDVRSTQIAIKKSSIHILLNLHSMMLKVVE